VSGVGGRVEGGDGVVRMQIVYFIGIFIYIYVLYFAFWGGLCGFCFCLYL